MPNISVILADAQYLIRIGLKHILDEQAGIEVIGEASNEASLFHLIELRTPDVIIIDYNQPDNFSPNSIIKIKNKYPNTGILVISGDNEKRSIYGILEAGVTSFLTKSCDENEIIEGIFAAAQQEKYFCKKVMDYVFERSFSKVADDCAPLPLTQREIEIVQQVAKGLIAKEIADTLNITTHTVYTHRKNIMRKLKINTSSELILYAVNKGLVRS